MLALLDELHYVFFVLYVERPIADTKRVTIITVDCTIFYRFILFIAK